MTWSLMIHGGAGQFERGVLSTETEAKMRAGLGAALDAGAAVLARGGAALDAVEGAVRVLEDDPSFNAGRGAALTLDGKVELDAAIMDGADRSAGAVTGVSATRHPVSLARAVMERSPHVFMSGTGADALGRELGLEPASPEWFATPERRAQLAALRTSRGAVFDAEMKYGTVGAVARDARGGLTAATSTGGVTGQRSGRIGDTPVIGAGTWADATAAVSCTGTGETFLRVGAAHAIAARLRYLGELPGEAAAAVLADVTALGGTGGAIIMPATGAPGWAFTTPGMNRGTVDANGARSLAVFGDE